mgnify:CR=1 FL=1
MNRNIFIILFIFLVPLALYWGLTKNKSFTVLPSIAFNGPEIIKFSSPMCYECQELEKIFDEIYPGYANKITLRKIDVTQNDKSVKQLIKEYDVKLFKDFKFTAGPEERIAIIGTNGVGKTTLLKIIYKVPNIGK